MDYEEERNKRKQRLLDAFQKVFVETGEDGKLVLDWCAKESGMLECNHVPGDAYSTAFKEGARYFVLNMMNKISEENIASRVRSIQEENKRRSVEL